VGACRTVLLAALAVLGACAGKAFVVEDAVPGDVTLLKTQDLLRVYFEPFDTSHAALEGDHGAGEEVENNRRLWFPHLLIGAQREIAARVPDARVVAVGEGPSEHAKEAMRRTATSVAWATAVPERSVVVSGEYVVSREVLGGRGVLGGRSHTRVEVTIRVGDAEVYHCAVDGRYDDDGPILWDYQTLGANESAGRGIADLLVRLRAGEED